MKRTALIVTALPSWVFALVSLAWLAQAAVGEHPFWTHVRLTPSEAAALHDAGELARLAASGQDLNGMYGVRAGFLDSEEHTLTPMEAARAARRPEIVQLLLELGARP
jgi:hypothetical protein